MNIFVNNVEDILIDIVVIGYHDKGESIALFLYEKSTGLVLYTAIIDSYRLSDLHKTCEILDKRGVGFVDMLCWTHPDEDHTVGLIDIINSYCTNKTKFILPEAVYGDNNDPIEYSSYDKVVFDKINQHNTARCYNVHSVSSLPQGSTSIEKREYSDVANSGTLVFSIKAVAPISAITRRRVASSSLCVTKNDFSVALLVNLGGFSFFLSGDIQNQTIQHLSKDFLQYLTLLKVPHHTSQSSNLLLRMIKDADLDAQIPISCTTVFRRHDLPNDDLVQEYKIYSKIFHSTGFKCDNREDKFGLLKYSFSPLDNKITSHLEGNAVQL